MTTNNANNALRTALQNLLDLADGFNVSGTYFNEFPENRTAINAANEALSQSEPADRLPGAVQILIRAGHSTEEARALINESASAQTEREAFHQWREENDHLLDTYNEPDECMLKAYQAGCKSITLSASQQASELDKEDADLYRWIRRHAGNRVEVRIDCDLMESSESLDASVKAARAVQEKKA